MVFEVELRHRQGAFDLDASFAAPAGVTVLFGRSGSGKSTVIKSVAGLLPPDQGRIALGGRVVFDRQRGVNIPPHKRRVGYVFQDGLLFPHLNVRQNLKYGQRFAPRHTRFEGFDKIVHMLGLDALLDRFPGQLSGGEKQRVAIGRALLSGPEVLLADEPLSALDDPRKAEILPYFERMRDELQIPILYVSHSPDEVARLATTIVVLERGKILRTGPADDVLADADVTPVGIRGAGALIRAAVVSHHEDGLTELVAGGQTLFVPKVSGRIGAQLRLRVAAHDVVIALSRPEGLSTLNIVPAQIQSVRAGDGPAVLLKLKTPAGDLLARVTKRSAQALALVQGTACYAVIKSVSIDPFDVNVTAEKHPLPPISKG
ncbi:Sulfate/thiosulfate import ATP-binding protein CysA [Tritonibacter multivorans]|uniref:Sulfate/thiosulfate import ATP-binding protein CysA n=1 Tax=Tritonibacter multivorans TaxID=928856 RepID=A0A0P1GM18_9RHOB|nr:Sulfate/thiosulfate import ATP-binding protein CysA [Tritonibacter multivorans]SFD63828.1 molybdate transport system ATP-binding protein [Tritonibacter multivorans]